MACASRLPSSCCPSASGATAFPAPCVPSGQLHGLLCDHHQLVLDWAVSRAVTYSAAGGLKSMRAVARDSCACPLGQRQQAAATLLLLIAAAHSSVPADWTHGYRSAEGRKRIASDISAALGGLAGGPVALPRHKFSAAEVAASPFRTLPGWPEPCQVCLYWAAFRHACAGQARAQRHRGGGRCRDWSSW